MVLNHPIRPIPRAVSDAGIHKGAVHPLVDSLILWGSWHMESICFSSQRLFLWQRKQLVEKENVHNLYCTSMFRDQQSTFPSTAKVICGYFYATVNDNSSQEIIFSCWNELFHTVAPILHACSRSVFIILKIYPGSPRINLTKIRYLHSWYCLSTSHYQTK